MTDQETRDRLSDFGALAITLYGEARSEPVEGRIAVGSVIRNRLRTPRRFGQTYRAVCHARAQFSCWWAFGGELNYAAVYRLARATVEHQALPLRGEELKLYQECQFIAEGIIAKQLRDRVKLATHYYNPLAMKPRGTVPEWARGLTPVAKVGQHLFFAGVL
jgi:spore germination cell wall hydrolase CwlJ-like protein